MEEFTFEEAQRNPSLLNPVESDISTMLERKANVQENGSIPRQPRAMQPGYVSSAGRVPNGNGIGPSVVEANGNVHHIVMSHSETEEEARLQRQQREFREARKREKDEDKKRRAVIREAEERKMAIEEAIIDRRRIMVEEQKTAREKKLLADLTAGRSENEALGRQVIGLWQVSSHGNSSEMILIVKFCRCTLKSSRPTKNQLAQRQSLIKDAQAVIDQRWPNCGLKLAPFGSTQTGLVENMSDLDLTLLDPMRPHGIGTVSKSR